MTDQAVTFQPADVLKEANDFIKDHKKRTGETLAVDALLVSSLKQWNNTIHKTQLGIQEIRFLNKATNVSLADLKAQRIAADRNGGGVATSKLTRKINAGRRIVNQARIDLTDAREGLVQFKASRDAILVALRSYYASL